VSYVPYLECLSSMIPTHVSVAIGFVGGEDQDVEDGGFVLCNDTSCGLE
jgi:hypothetical protein